MYDMAATATLSSTFQISIPKAVLDEQQWQAGQEFVLIPKGKGVLVMPVPTLDELSGIARGASTNKHRYCMRKIEIKSTAFPVVFQQDCTLILNYPQI